MQTTVKAGDFDIPKNFRLLNLPFLLPGLNTKYSSQIATFKNNIKGIKK